MIDYIEKIETLLSQAEAAFELTQDGLTHPEELPGLWQRANYRLALAQTYTGLAQVRNTETVANAAGKIANTVEENN